MKAHLEGRVAIMITGGAEPVLRAAAVPLGTIGKSAGVRAKANYQKEKICLLR